MRFMKVVLVAALLASCGGGGGGGPAAQAPAAQAAPTSVIATALTCLQPGVPPAILASAEGVQTLRRACLGELLTATNGLPLSEAGRDAVLAAMIAYRFAPYGSSKALTYFDILLEPKLDCDNYVLLAGYIFELLRPGASLTYFGFDGGAIGNHAQAIYTDATGPVLLDPTVGVAATIGFDDLLSGRTGGVRIVADMRQPDAVVSPLHDKVIEAVSKGGYKPSDLLYWFPDRAAMLTHAAHTGEFWISGDKDGLLVHFPTPGSTALRKQLD